MKVRPTMNVRHCLRKIRHDLVRYAQQDEDDSVFSETVGPEELAAMFAGGTPPEKPEKKAAPSDSLAPILDKVAPPNEESLPSRAAAKPAHKEKAKPRRVADPRLRKAARAIGINPNHYKNEQDLIDEVLSVTSVGGPYDKAIRDAAVELGIDPDQAKTLGYNQILSRIGGKGVPQDKVGLRDQVRGILRPMLQARKYLEHASGLKKDPDYAPGSRKRPGPKNPFEPLPPKDQGVGTFTSKGSGLPQTSEELNKYVVVRGDATIPADAAKRLTLVHAVEDPAAEADPEAGGDTIHVYEAAHADHASKAFQAIEAENFGKGSVEYLRGGGPLAREVFSNSDDEPTILGQGEGKGNLEVRKLGRDLYVVTDGKDVNFLDRSTRDAFVEARIKGGVDQGPPKLLTGGLSGTPGAKSIGEATGTHKMRPDRQADGEGDAPTASLPSRALTEIHPSRKAHPLHKDTERVIEADLRMIQAKEDRGESLTEVDKGRRLMLELHRKGARPAVVERFAGDLKQMLDELSHYPPNKVPGPLKDRLEKVKGVFGTLDPRVIDAATTDYLQATGRGTLDPIYATKRRESKITSVIPGEKAYKEMVEHEDKSLRGLLGEKMPGRKEDREAIRDAVNQAEAIKDSSGKSLEQQALAMARRGLSPSVIAQRLADSAKQVEGWDKYGTSIVDTILRRSGLLQKDRTRIYSPKADDLLAGITQGQSAEAIGQEHGLGERAVLQTLARAGKLTPELRQRHRELLGKGGAAGDLTVNREPEGEPHAAAPPEADDSGIPESILLNRADKSAGSRPWPRPTGLIPPKERPRAANPAVGDPDDEPERTPLSPPRAQPLRKGIAGGPRGAGATGGEGLRRRGVGSAKIQAVQAMRSLKSQIAQANAEEDYERADALGRDLERIKQSHAGIKGPFDSQSVSKFDLLDPYPDDVPWGSEGEHDAQQAVGRRLREIDHNSSKAARDIMDEIGGAAKRAHQADEANQVDLDFDEDQAKVIRRSTEMNRRPLPGSQDPLGVHAGHAALLDAVFSSPYDPKATQEGKSVPSRGPILSGKWRLRPDATDLSSSKKFAARQMSEAGEAAEPASMAAVSRLGDKTEAMIKSSGTEGQDRMNVLAKLQPGWYRQHPEAQKKDPAKVKAERLAKAKAAKESQAKDLPELPADMAAPTGLRPAKSLDEFFGRAGQAADRGMDPVARAVQKPRTPGSPIEFSAAERDAHERFLARSRRASR